MHPSTVTVHARDFYDIVIVGAGPSSLAMSARLREPYPTAIYTDVEHQRFSFLRKHGVSVQTRTHKDLKQPRRANASSPRSFSPRIAVLDQCEANWMANWRAQFESFGITHLRSPMFFHGHPDIEAMQAYAHRMGREDELVEICGIVGQEKSKHQQKRKRGKKLPRTDINERGISDDPGMALYTTSGRIIGAKVVIFAAGIGTQPCLPDFVSTTPHDTRAHVTHTSEMTGAECGQTFLPPRISSAISIRPTSAVVIGGGLTSAQIVDRLVQSGVEKVYLVCRSHIKVKHFDFGLDWVSKYKNVKKAAFWNEEDMSARMRMIKEAREGGSVNPVYYNRLKKLVDEGRLEILSGQVVREAHWSDEAGWELKLCEGEAHPDSDRDVEGVDHIWCATGSAPDISTIRCLQTIRETHPIGYCDGLPCLTDDLQWNGELPLFVIGGFAALHIGPTAYNLEGGRAAAERVAQRLESVLLGFQDHGNVAEFYSDPRNSNFFDPLDDSDG
ncbi:hypothetical protein BDZ89DRAFT_1084584 [Hymenopellis radicata]|nr:hypothetical protein BDZ89DRAFT_1084584 [Hymenopellis radicata]